MPGAHGRGIHIGCRPAAGAHAQIRASFPAKEAGHLLQDPCLPRVLRGACARKVCGPWDWRRRISEPGAGCSSSWWCGWSSRLLAKTSRPAKCGNRGVCLCSPHVPPRNVLCRGVDSRLPSRLLPNATSLCNLGVTWLYYLPSRTRSC